jgi:hypothetical protein
MSFDYETRQEWRSQGNGRERIDFGHTAQRWLTWLKTRPTENWIFFAAGLVLGGIVM